ncbi:MAG: ATP-binding protein [Lactobacillaceae bacterium]|nr:ATP-binding protein [Lactobacillaceae bacterium]
MKQEMTNPFSASFGLIPTKTVGRENIVSGVAAVMGDYGSDWRTTLITGVRGSGKTTLLMKIKESLDAKGILTIKTTASEENMLGDMTLSLQRAITASNLEIKNTTLNLGALKVEIGAKGFDDSFKSRMTDLFDNVHGKDNLIAFIVDEVNNSQALRRFATAYQEWTLEGYKIMFIGAGLPWHVESLITGKTTSFLQRAHKELLLPIEVSELKNDFVAMFSTTGKSIPLEIAEEAAVISKGYPYVFQLLGSRMWDLTLAGSVVSESDLNLAVAYAKDMMYKNVYALLISELTKFEQIFLIAMSEDADVSLMSQIRLRTEKETSYLAKYRQRLIEQGLITGLERGKVKFTLPFLREYLQNHFVEASFDDWE